MTAQGQNSAAQDAQELSRAEIERYSRQLLLPGFAAAMPKLRAARVLIVGAGGLGTPLATYLAGAGVGTLTLCDGDEIALSNLQRQILYATPDVGRSKAEVAAARLQMLNPGARVNTAPFLNSGNASDLIGSHDLVIDASDNFGARYLVSDVCTALGKRWVWGAAGGFEGMLCVFGDGLSLRSVFPDARPENGDDCDTVGVLGPLLGVVASAMAVEVLKLIGGVGEPLLGRLWTYDALSARARVVALR